VAQPLEVSRAGGGLCVFGSLKHTQACGGEGEGVWTMTVVVQASVVAVVGVVVGLQVRV